MDITELYSKPKNKKLSSNELNLQRKLNLRFSNPLETRSVTFHGDSVRSSDICSLLRRSPLLEHLNLVSINDIVPILRQICRSNKRIESLSLQDCSSNGNVVPKEALKNILLSLPVLRKIDLKQTKIQSESFYRLVSTAPNITSLDLSLNETVTYRDLLSIVHNSRLKEFKITRRHKKLNISDLEMAYLIKCLKRQLTLLDLDMSGMGSHTYTEIFQCVNLTDLKLNYAMNLTSELLSSIPSSLKKIQCLKLEGPTMLLDNDLFTHLFNNSGFSQQLTTLQLENFDSMTDEECRKILTACSKLKVLSLKGCKTLTVRGILKDLTGLTSLVQLNLGFTGCLDGLEEISSLPLLNEIIVDYRTYAMTNLNKLKTSTELKCIKFYK